MSKKKLLLIGMVVIALLLSAGGYYFYWSYHPHISISAATATPAEADYHNELFMVSIAEHRGIPTASRVEKELMRMAEWNDQIATELSDYDTPYSIRVSGETDGRKVTLRYHGYVTGEHNLEEYQREETFDLVVREEDFKLPEPINGAWLEEHVQDVTLKIYYMSPYSLTYRPLKAADLARGGGLHITVDAKTIEAHKDLICRVLDAPTTPMDTSREIYMNARVYYALCNRSGEPLFDVAMWGTEDAIFVNGVPCEEDPIFYDVLMEFLPEGAATELKIYLEKGFSGLDEVEKLYQEAGGSLY